MIVNITTSNGQFMVTIPDVDVAPARQHFKALVKSVGAGAQVPQAFALSITDHAGDHCVSVQGKVCKDFAARAERLLDMYYQMKTDTLTYSKPRNESTTEKEDVQ